MQLVIGLGFVSWPFSNPLRATFWFGNQSTEKQQQIDRNKNSFKFWKNLKILSPEKCWISILLCGKIPSEFKVQDWHKSLSENFAPNVFVEDFALSILDGKSEKIRADIYLQHETSLQKSGFAKNTFLENSCFIRSSLDWKLNKNI